jgi:hypothetical protein
VSAALTLGGHEKPSTLLTGGIFRIEFSCKDIHSTHALEIFQRLEEQQESLAKEIIGKGESLSWDDEKLTISLSRPEGGDIHNDEQSLEELRTWAANKLTNFRNAFEPKI